jgi:glucosyl-dolichyl phosphate glucuronosyltransferase
MNVTVAIPTYNRASCLEATLATLEQVHSRGQDYEVIVVNNRSTDATADVCDRLAPRFGGRLRHIYEERLGLSNARNRAIQEARHEIVAFLDDDVDVDPDWLRAICDAYRSGDYAVVGGKAHLVYPCARPRWLSDETEGLLTKVDLGPVRREAQPGELYGLNLSFRKEWFGKVGLFRPDLGRIGKCLLSSEEQDLLTRISLAGGGLLYEPAAVVGHRVPPERLKRSWFWSRAYWGGCSGAKLAPENLVSTYQFSRSTWHVGLATWRTASAAVRHGPSSEESFCCSRTLMGQVGYWVGLAARLPPGLRPRPGGKYAAGSGRLTAHEPVS